MNSLLVFVLAFEKAYEVNHSIWWTLQFRGVLSKWEGFFIKILESCLLALSLLRNSREDGLRQERQLSFWWKTLILIKKTSHFDRTPQYSLFPNETHRCKKLHGSQSVLKPFKWLITPLQIISTTEMYLIAPENLTSECTLDYFESRVIVLQSCVSFRRKE